MESSPVPEQYVQKLNKSIRTIAITFSCSS